MRTLALAALIASAHVAHGAPHAGRAVTIATAADTSPGALDTDARRRHGEIVRHAMLDVLRRSGVDVGQVGRQLDVTVVAWKIVPRGAATEVTAELRVIVCDGHGKMLAIVNGRATVAGGRNELNALREQALAGAIGGMQRTIKAQLARAVA